MLCILTRHLLEAFLLHLGLDCAVSQFIATAFGSFLEREDHLSSEQGQLIVYEFRSRLHNHYINGKSADVLDICLRHRSCSLSKPILHLPALLPRLDLLVL